MNLQLRSQTNDVRRSILKGMDVPSRGRIVRAPQGHYPYDQRAQFQPSQSSQIHSPYGHVEVMRRSY